ncbi:MAG TPA: ATP-dependent protease [Methanoculleus sp.]|nr:ATP-dependent protease [Methanoculleus sp.]
MKRERILGLLLLASLLANAALLAFPPPHADTGGVEELESRIDALEKENEDLARVRGLEEQLQRCPAGTNRTASLQAPAVLQTVRRVPDPPFVREEVVEEGAMINVSVEVRPGRGRVLVQTTPLMGVMFQNAATTAAFVAEETLDTSLAASDVIFSIEARDEVPAVDGPSSGALMALLLIAALEGEDLDENQTLTGTINPAGAIGAVGGILLKAQAAHDAGKTRILLPRENSRIVRSMAAERTIGGVTIIERRARTIDAKTTIEEEIGIEVVFVDTIDDVRAETARDG